jgi:nucleoside 2-deoxyribosyltransferase
VHAGAGAPTVYVASPLGFTPAGQRWSEEELLPALVAAGLEPLDPWMLTPEVDAALAAALVLADGAGRRTNLADVNRRIGEANAFLIREADGMLAVLDGSDVDSGTAAEIGFASALAKPVVGLRTDLRRAGDNDGAVVNLQVEYFVRATGGPIVTDAVEAAESLAALLGVGAL